MPDFLITHHCYLEEQFGLVKTELTDHSLR